LRQPIARHLDPITAHTKPQTFLYNVGMPETLLRTKLFVPPLRPNLVPRPQLIERLNQGLTAGKKLTLVSAPAGFGKTTLVNVWTQQTEQPIAWLSLDENDNDPIRFLAYLVAALNQVEGIDATIGRGALDMLHSPQPPPAESILTSLINDVTAVSEGIIFILDDYHLIDSSPVDDALTFMLDHLPPQMHLVIATREDPHLPLSRLRARGQLTELRGADLRFAYSDQSLRYSDTSLVDQLPKTGIVRTRKH
jgi:LuxR family maltose regulon positive regulatory protein